MGIRRKRIVTDPTGVILDGYLDDRYVGVPSELLGGGDDPEPQVFMQPLTFVHTAGDVLEAGTTAAFYVHDACTLDAFTALGVGSGSVRFDVRVDSYANAPPTSGDSICGSNKPEITGASKYIDTSLTGWTKSIPAGSWVFVVIETIATFVKLNVSLKFTKD